jgi:hypothetical protein
MKLILMLASVVLFFSACEDVPKTLDAGPEGIKVDEELLAKCPEVEGVVHPLAKQMKTLVPIQIQFEWYDLEGNYLMGEKVDMDYDPSNPDPELSTIPEVKQVPTKEGYYILKTMTTTVGQTVTDTQCMYIEAP